MSWWRRDTPDNTQADAERERRLTAAEQEAAQLRERADKVGAALREQLRTNHWGDAIAAIVRRI